MPLKKKKIKDLESSERDDSSSPLGKNKSTSEISPASKNI